MPMYDSAFSMKTSQAPTAATSTPAIAGPIARDTLMAMLFKRDGRWQLVGGERDPARSPPTPASSSPRRRRARR